MQAAVDPHDRLAVPRELARLIVGEAVGERQLAVRLLDELQPPMVLGRRDDGRQLGPAFFGLADLGHDHALGLHVELPEVIDVLRVVDEVVVVADGVAELVLRRRDPRCGRLVLRHRRSHTDRENDSGRDRRGDRRRTGPEACLPLEHTNLVK